MAKRPRRDAKKDGRPKKSAVVYTTSTCVHCRLLVEYLVAKGIPHTTKDIVDDEGAMLELAELTGGRVQVPSVVVGGVVLVKPDWKKLDRMIRRKT